MLESTYSICLRHRLRREGLDVKAEVPIGITFDGLQIPTAYRIDLVVEDVILVELKSVEQLLPVHISQTLTYVRHAKLEAGLLLNFNVKSLRLGIRCFDNRGFTHQPSPPSQTFPALPFTL